MLSKMIKHQHTNTENSQALKWELLERCGPLISPFHLLVYTVFGSVKSSVLVAEFKPSNQNSYVESDLVKLGKQMKMMMNQLVSIGVVEPKVCGILCEGDSLCTYVMDLAAPKLYRMICIANVKVFKNIDQISFLPEILSHLLCLHKICVEIAIISGCSTLKRPATCPPLYWKETIGIYNNTRKGIWKEAVAQIQEEPTVPEFFTSVSERVRRGSFSETAHCCRCGVGSSRNPYINTQKCAFCLNGGKYIDEKISPKRPATTQNDVNEFFKKRQTTSKKSTEDQKVEPKKKRL